MRRLGIIHMGLALLILMQGVLPVAGMAQRAVMAMPQHDMTTQCSHMDPADAAIPMKNQCSPGADCCLVKAGVQPMATCARTIPPRLVVVGLLITDKDSGPIQSHGPDLLTESEAPPSSAIPLYKAKKAFLI